MKFLIKFIIRWFKRYAGVKFGRNTSFVDCKANQTLFNWRSINLHQNKNRKRTWYFDMHFLLKIRVKGNWDLYSIVRKSTYFESFFTKGFSLWTYLSYWVYKVFNRCICSKSDVVSSLHVTSYLKGSLLAELVLINNSNKFCIFY